VKKTKPPTATPVVSALEVIPSRLSPEDQALIHELGNSNPTSTGAFVARVAQLLTNRYRFALQASSDLCVYQSGCYRSVDEEWLRDAIFDNLPSAARPRYSIRTRLEITDHLKAKKPHLWGQCPKGQMAVGNGILDFPSATIKPHTPDWLSTLKLPLRYDPIAQCPKWDQFLSEVFPIDAIDLAWEIIGVSMTTDLMVQEAIWLRGTGGNGKSTFMKAVEALLGKENTCSVPIQDLTSDRFATSSLYGKLLLLDHDTPIDRIPNVSIFKKITAHDEVRAQEKHKQSFSFHPFCKVLMASNGDPDSSDTTYGFLRRILIVPFTGLVENSDNSAARRPQQAILDELSTMDEQSGALNKAILGWQRVNLRGGFTIPESIQTEIETFRVDSDPIRQFFDARIEITANDEDFVSSKDLAQGYEAFAETLPAKLRRASVTPTAITQWLNAHVHRIKASGKVRYSKDCSGNRRGFRGVRISEEDY
jgi:P4 family phage/plasmid primase-like protien